MKEANRGSDVQQTRRVLSLRRRASGRRNSEASHEPGSTLVQSEVSGRNEVMS